MHNQLSTQNSQRQGDIPSQDDALHAGEIVPLNGGHNEMAFIAQYGSAKMLHNVMDQPACQRLQAMNLTTYAKSFMQRRLREEGFTEQQYNDLENEMQDGYAMYEQQIHLRYEAQQEMKEEKQENNRERMMEGMIQMERFIQNSRSMELAQSRYDERMAKIENDREILERSKGNMSEKDYALRNMDLNDQERIEEREMEETRDWEKENYKKEQAQIKENKAYEAKVDEYNAKIDSGEIEGRRMEKGVSVVTKGPTRVTGYDIEAQKNEMQKVEGQQMGAQDMSAPLLTTETKIETEVIVTPITPSGP